MTGPLQLPERPPLSDRDTTERLSTDDMASVYADDLLSAAMQRQQRAAEATPASEPGVCVNCDRLCLPMAVYCDAECRRDHETRGRADRRQGRGQ